MRFGYNTNGFAHHRLEDAIAILATLGYRSVALTMDYQALNPYSRTLGREVRSIRQLLDKHGLRCVIETGARFLLDPWRKHQPTLLSANLRERRERLHFLRVAILCAAGLQADAVSFWSGTPSDDAPEEVLWRRLRNGCRKLCDYADKRGVRLAFEPEPGMFIDTMTKFTRLHSEVQHPRFGLTLDIGHLHCLGETPLAEYITRFAPQLWNVHIEDMKRGVHDHLMFGEGEIDFVPVLAALRRCGYQGGVHVELSRHSHNAVETARQALAALQAYDAVQS